MTCIMNPRLSIGSTNAYRVFLTTLRPALPLLCLGYFVRFEEPAFAVTMSTPYLLRLRRGTFNSNIFTTQQ